MKLSRPILAVSFLNLILAPNSWAHIDPTAKLTSLVEQLQKTVLRLEDAVTAQNEKIRSLERREPQVQIPAPSGGEGVQAPMTDYEFNERLNTALGGAHKWLKDLKMSGDLRLRYEAFDFTSGAFTAPNAPTETDSRNRFRFRLRYGFEKPLPHDFKVGFAMASGESASTGNDSGLQVDPASTNQTFDNLFNFKDIWIEKAFATYTPAWILVHPILKKFEVSGGKFTNPFEKGSSDLVWDRDVKPEGAYEKLDLEVYKGSDVEMTAYGIAGQFVLDEDLSASNNADAELFAYQGGINLVADTPYLERPVDWISSVSLYDFSDYGENGNFMIGGTSLARGNSNFIFAATELDANEFQILEFYNEAALYPYGVPVRPFLDIAHNFGANRTTQDDETWAWAFGTKFGGIVKKGDWELSYDYKRIENNAVVGAFNDSDFGLGHSGKRGSQLKLGYALTDNLTLNGAAWFVNNLTTGTAGVRDEEQRRFQADLVWKF